MVICKIKNCTKHAQYGLEISKPLVCKIHNVNNYLFVALPKCRESECHKFAHYGIDKNHIIHCKEHKLENEIDPKRKVCAYEGCTKSPSFGVNGTKKHCKDHKQDDETDIHKKCKYKDCNVRPSYGLEKHKPVYCKSHAPSDYMDVIHNKCVVENCKIRPTFGSINGKPIHCDEHRLVGEKDVTSHVLCELCDKRPTYGYESFKPIHCKEHKLLDEVDVINVNKLCKYEQCTARASFGLKKGKPNHCSIHKQDKEYNVVSKYCTNCNLCLPRKGYDLCSYCLPNESVIAKRKEEIVKNFLNQNNIMYQREFYIGKSCGANRVDYLLDIGTHFIALEVDEFQHTKGNYQTSCEYARMNNIQISLGLPIIFLRFNPDPFTVDKVLDENI